METPERRERALGIYLLTLSSVLGVSTFHCFYQCPDRRQKADMRFKMTSLASKVGPKKSGTKPTGWDLMGVNVMPSIEVQKINCPKYSMGAVKLEKCLCEKAVVFIWPRTQYELMVG